MSNSSWLPELVMFDEYNGDWLRYVEAIYSIFKADFIDSKPGFHGRRMGLKRHPVVDGKEATFWHFIQEGPVENERIPDLRRCERIRWPKPIIESSAKPQVHWWSNKRGGETRILLALEDFSYVVVLADRGDYVLPWTAYYVEKMHSRKKLEKEFNEFKMRGNKG